MRTFTRMMLMFFFSAIVIQCGGDPEAEGDQAYNQGSYKKALAHYQEVKKSQPENPNIDQKIALSYMHYGKQLFGKTRNLKAFIGNFEKGQDLLPEDPSTMVKSREFSQLLYELASAYYKTKPANEIQKEQYFNRTLELLDEALIIDYENNSADSLLASIKEEHFQKTFEKGVQFYDQARKEKNNGDLYLSAERYLSRAVSFNPDSKEAQKYLQQTRKKTVSIPDYAKDFAYVIAAMMHRGNRLLIDFTGFNNSGAVLEFDPQKLVVIDSDQNEYVYDKEETDKLSKGMKEVKSLNARDRIDGEIAYKVPRSADLLYLQYTMSDGKYIRKYFP